ncbi:MAG: glycosyltransferase, partial [Planctomycetes bacterium]|nr:glycosyltransferase [Planctomycetota bacterium]
CIVGDDGNRDALPTVLLEALAAGLPVLSTPIAGVAEIVDEGRAGLLVPPGDVGALARDIARLLGDAALRARLASAGRARAERCFDLAHNTGVLRDWFAGAIAANTGTARSAVGSA